MVVVLDCAIQLIFASVGKAAVVEGGGISWIELDRFVVVLDGAVVLIFRKVTTPRPRKASASFEFRRMALS